jgi:hypothetical protein
MEETCWTETLVDFQRTTRRYVPEYTADYLLQLGVWCPSYCRYINNEFTRCFYKLGYRIIQI